MNNSFNNKRVLVIGAQNSMLIVNHCIAMNKILGETELLLLSSNFSENELSIYKENNIKVFPYNYKKPKYYKNSILRNLAISIYISNFLEMIPYFDVCHLNYISPGLAVLNRKLRKKCSLLISSVWGSDLLRRNWLGYLSKKKLYELSDIITFSNEITMNHFSKIFNGTFDNKLVIARYGLAILREIQMLSRGGDRSIYKRTLGIPENKICIACGCNGKKTQQHIEIIKSMKEFLRPDLQKRVFLLFPMTYGYDKDYVSIVEEIMKKTHITYKIVKDRLSDTDMAVLRLSCDIMINVQESDQLSGAMLEHLYARALVVYGGWLPYEYLERGGVKMWRVETIKQVGSQIVDLVENFEEYKVEIEDNQKFVYDLASEESCSLKWKHLYQKGNN